MTLIYLFISQSSGDREVGEAWLKGGHELEMTEAGW